MSSQPEVSKLPHYTSYLVRLWQDSRQGPWRASAQSVQTGERVLFASLAELFTFLEGQTLVDSAEYPQPAIPPDT
jgi:hypothetical protein